MNIYRHDIETSIGRLVLLATDRGLCYVGFADVDKKGADSFIAKHYPDGDIHPEGKHNLDAAEEIRAYLDGKLTRFTVPVDLTAAGFNREVLQAVKRIPYGETLTYGEIAAKLGRPKAARAVGNANRLNPVPLIIPCHRVVSTQGPGGFGGTPQLKKRLLRLEGGEQ